MDSKARPHNFCAEMATTCLEDLVRTTEADPSLLSDFDLARLQALASNRTRLEENEFVLGIGDEDRPILQAARTLVLCERHFVDGAAGSVVGSNCVSRQRADIVFNPDQDDNGVATERSSFIASGVSLNPTVLGRMAADTRRDYRYLKVYVDDTTVFYISALPFWVKNLLLDDHVPSIAFEGFNVAAL